MSDQESNPSNDGGDTLFTNTNFLIIVWVLSFLIFACTPFCVSKYRRTLWLKRLRLCQWNVYVEPERDPEWYRIAMERYEAYRSRAAELEQQNGDRRRALTKEEEEEVRQLFLLERMAGFTMTIKQDNIRDKASVEIQQLSAQQKSGCGLNLTEIAGTSTENISASVSSDIEEGLTEDKERESNSDGQLTASDVEEGVDSAGNDADNRAASDIEVGTKVNDHGDEAGDIPAAAKSGIEEEAVSKHCQENCSSADGESSDDEGENIGFGAMEEADTYIGVPYPGVALLGENTPIRFEPNGCAICLCEFEAGERVSWSATEGDPHVFHEDCMMNYLLSVGNKAARRRRRHPEDQDANRDPIETATDFSMLCPCCRQQFVSKTSILPDDITNESPESESESDEDLKESSANQENANIADGDADLGMNITDPAEENASINNDLEAPSSTSPQSQGIAAY